MKKATLFLLGFAVVFLFIFQFPLSKKEIKSVTKSSSISPSIIPSVDTQVRKEETYLFVPYWGFEKDIDDIQSFDEIFYFGIVPTIEGIDKKDNGYKKIPQFLSLTKNSSEKFLVIRMIDSKLNSQILENKESQKKIISESLEITKQYGFNGIVLDFEISALAFESVTKKITDFYTLFYSSSHESNLKEYITVYGDVFFRARPYDVKEIAKNSDKVVIMAYDFHKAKGNPGPNFPLSGRNKYGYDFQIMISDFVKVVPKEKLVVVFGLFGYDWIVNEKKEAVGQVDALSLVTIQNKFINQCQFKNCSVQKDAASSETKIEYTDNESRNHIVWFEDMDSVSKKKEFLKEKGIYSTALWAYSYF